MLIFQACETMHQYKISAPINILLRSTVFLMWKNIAAARSDKTRCTAKHLIQYKLYVFVIVEFIMFCVSQPTL